MSETDSEIACYQLLGRFIERYAKLEAAVHLIFRYCAGLPDHVGRTIDGGMRLSDLMSAIRRMIKVRMLPVDISAEIESVLDQINLISPLRDKLVHRGFEITEGDFVSTNNITAKLHQDIEVLRVNQSEIEAATDDCYLAYLKFMRVHQPGHELWNEPAIKEWLTFPWSYKPREPERPNQGRRPTGQ